MDNAQGKTSLLRLERKGNAQGKTSLPMPSSAMTKISTGVSLYSGKNLLNTMTILLIYAANPSNVRNEHLCFEGTLVPEKDRENILKATGGLGADAHLLPTTGKYMLKHVGLSASTRRASWHRPKLGVPSKIKEPSLPWSTKSTRLGQGET
ncbi:Subtilisin-like protease SBT1-7 [Nymphaea thermarum]|nr:Subtilisin-like protease SBT1-7 [Nymphaea thermarum]